MSVKVGYALSFAWRTAAMALVAAVLTGCSSTSGESEGGSSKLANLFAFNTTTPTTVTTAKAAVYCPPVTVQAGTAAFTLYEPGKEGNLLAVKNQANFSTIARECVDMGGEAGIRIGVAGRLMQGPRGTTGTSVDVPIRFVVLDAEDKPVLSRVTRIQAVIPPGQTGVSFTHVEELGTFPVTERGLRNWSLRIGFETAAPRGAR